MGRTSSQALAKEPPSNMGRTGIVEELAEKEEVGIDGGAKTK